MTEMTRRERIMAATNKKRADKLPFMRSWSGHQIGSAERECRNRGAGTKWERPSHLSKMHGVDVTEAQAMSSGEVVLRRTFSTPVGSVYEDEKRELGVGKWAELALRPKGLNSWRNVGPRQISRLIKGPEDYKVVKYMVENTEYTPYYLPIEQAIDWVVDDGIATAWLPSSPLQMLTIHWIGNEDGSFSTHHAKYPDLVDDLYRAISKSYEPLYEIAAKSPATVINLDENIDGVLISPKLFQKYVMPSYEKEAEILHKHGKLMASHLDGRLDVLKDLIAKTPLDIVEAFHPPPMGDLPLGEALSLWKDKVIWLGFPGSVYSLGPEAVKNHALDLLREIGSGDRLVIEMNTENLVSNENLLMLTSVLENADLPLTKEKIDRIERSLA